MQRRCPKCNNIAILQGEYYYCKYCRITFPKYEIAEPFYEEQKFLDFDFTSRLLVFVVGFFFAIIAYLSFLGLISTVEDNYPYTISSVLVIFWFASAICFIFAFSPITIHNIMKKHSNLDLTKFKHVIAFLIIISVILWVIGIQLFVQIVNIVENMYIKDKSVSMFLDETSEQLSITNLFFSLILNFLILGLGIIGYVILVYGDRYKPLEYLKLKFNFNENLYAIGIGMIVGIILLVLSGLAFYILHQMGMSQDNVLAERMSDIIKGNIILIFLIAFFSSTSEEIFFRGFLQKHIGIIPAALLFGIVHIGYLTPAQVAGPFILGIVWGLLLKKTDNLAAPIASHFMINFLTLALVM